MRVSDFDYELPEEFIAQDPIEPRDAARLLVLERSKGTAEHRVFRELPQLFSEGDLLVVNDTRVLPARLHGRKESGGAVEVLLLREVQDGVWESLVRPARRLAEGSTVRLAEGALTATVGERLPRGGCILRFKEQGVRRALPAVGHVPLPPYIRKPLARPERYQTVYGRREASAAAPTAGLHFTPRLLDELRSGGVGFAAVTLEVGLDTFQPVRTEEVENHRMHSERYEVSDQAAETVNQARAAGGRVIAVGTTTARVLETVADAEGRVRPGEGRSDLFIFPGHRFQAVDALITNFHLPRSSLLMLVAAFTGRDSVMGAYAEAKRLGYRFFSFGDAMVIL